MIAAILSAKAALAAAGKAEGKNDAMRNIIIFFNNLHLQASLLSLDCDIAPDCL